jgi:hypothetical protein
MSATKANQVHTTYSSMSNVLQKRAADLSEMRTLRYTKSLISTNFTPTIM